MSETESGMELLALRKKSKSSSGRDESFKKALFGLDSGEVEEYIKTLNSNAKSAQSAFDKKISELQDIIAMLTREKEGHTAQIDKQNEQIGIIENSRREMAEKLASLNEMESEWESLRKQNDIMVQEIKKYEDESSENEALKKQLCDITVKCDYFEGQNKALQNENSKLQSEKDTLEQSIIEQEKRYNSQISELKLNVFQIGRKNKYLTEQMKNSLKTIIDNVDAVSSSFDSFTNEN